MSNQTLPPELPRGNARAQAAQGVALAGLAAAMLTGPAGPYPTLVWSTKTDDVRRTAGWSL